MALAGGFAALFLGISGYVVNTEQIPEATHAIRLLFNIWPAVFSVGCALVLILYSVWPKKGRNGFAATKLRKMDWLDLPELIFSGFSARCLAH